MLSDHIYNNGSSIFSFHFCSHTKEKENKSNNNLKTSAMHPKKKTFEKKIQSILELKPQIECNLVEILENYKKWSMELRFGAAFDKNAASKSCLSCILHKRSST